MIFSVRSHDKSCVDTQIFGKKMLRDEYSFYMIIYVKFSEFLVLCISMFSVIYMKFDVN